MTCHLINKTKQLSRVTFYDMSFIFSDHFFFLKNYKNLYDIFSLLDNVI